MLCIFINFDFLHFGSIQGFGDSDITFIPSEGLRSTEFSRKSAGILFKTASRQNSHTCVGEARDFRRRPELNIRLFCELFGTVIHALKAFRMQISFFSDFYMVITYPFS